MKALQRRHTHLTERLKKWSRGDPAHTKAERSALMWAMWVIAGADEEGVLEQLAQTGRTALNRETAEREV